MDKRYTILTVDDEYVNIQLITSILREEYDIRSALGGHEAIEMLKQCTPDLILLDVMMPDLSGFDVCRIIRSDAGFNAVPIIFLTALDTQEGQLQGLELGGIDYLTKPVNRELLKIRVRNHLAMKEQRDQLIRQKEELEAERAALVLQKEQQLLAGEALKESESRWKFALEGAGDGVWDWNIESGEAFYSRRYKEMLGYEEDEIGTSSDEWLQRIHPEDVAGALTALQPYLDGKPGTAAVEFRMQCKDGSWKPILGRGMVVSRDGAGKPVRMIGTNTDLTDRKKAEDERHSMELQMLQVQKLESLGVLAGGIAHDFNNILTAIIGNADLALMRISKQSPAVDNLQRIEMAAARAADLAKQMLAYSGKGRFVIENINLNTLLEDMLRMLEVSISKKASLRINPYQHLPAVEVDATQMRQVIMNLVINASEAIGDRSGVIAISTGCIDCERNYLKDVWLDENIGEGLYVYLEIADSGCGMDKTTMAKIFDPFFTTKFTGRGLGMAAVLGIVRGHKGAIKVYSEINRGTTFKILLPASSRPVELFNGTGHHDDWQGAGTVLLVDDEESVRGIGAEMLKELGFMVITAEDGREGVETFRNNPGISFVILDLTMPHMDGEQCFRELRLLKPDVRVLMSSGYNEQEVTQKFVGKGLAGFIQKPYKLSELKDAVRKIYI